MSEEERKQGFKVNDRRSFEADGTERPEGEAKPAGRIITPDSVKEPAPAAQPAGDVESPDVGYQGDDEITFSAFLMSLATQALMQLGAMQPPPGVNLPVDPIAAKHTIDIISLLEQKTKGNLDKEEEYMMTEILHNLRMAFVQTSARR